MLTRRVALAGVTVGTMCLFGRAIRGHAESSQPSALEGLNSLALSKGFVSGCASSTFQLRDLGLAPTLLHEAGMIVPEFEMKRGALEPKPGQYDFDRIDAFLAFARQHQIAARGHTLVWHKANPPWLNETLQWSPKEAILTDYIAAVLGRYRGQVHSWDVVNEALLPSEGRQNLRETLWLKAFGPDYIDIAYHAARAVSPDALLVYNDQGCEAGDSEGNRFRAATLKFLECAKARGVPIDAYGMQGHLQAFGPRVDQRKLRDFLQQLEALNLRILVTEHDVDDSGGPLDIAVRDRAVADASRRFLDVVLDSRATIAVLTWGLSDRYLDPPGWQDVLKGYSPRILPLDADFKRKPMWNAMAASFRSARDKRPSTATSAAVNGSSGH